MTNKETLYFAGITCLCLFAVNTIAVLLTSSKVEGATIGLLLAFAIISASILAAVCHNMKCGENFLFEVSKPKLCEGGPYMRQGKPELDKYCSELLSTKQGTREYEQMNCTCPGFVGRPVTFNRTTMSNALWENEMCNPPPLTSDNNTLCTNKEFEPCVL